ncbi:MAG: non-canonical purine NTP pyrophosphatase [Terriglobales bacterium]
MTIYLATGNPGKVADFQALAQAGRAPEARWGPRLQRLELAPLPGFAALPPVEETGDCFEANARIKAEHYSHLVPGWVLADDSGLEVEVLNGAPGIYSARWRQLGDALSASGRPLPGIEARPPSDQRERPRQEVASHLAGRHGAAAANNRLLLERLQGVPAERRGARFVCVLALARAGQTVTTFAGSATGVILEAGRGRLGFGYDPLFYSPEAGCAFGELTREQKAAFSHRGQAARALWAWLRERPKAEH